MTTKWVWRPLDLHRMRLYEVRMTFHSHPHWNDRFIVAGHSPRHAASLMEEVYKDTIWQAEAPHFSGHALNIYRPEWEEMPDEAD